MAGLKVDVQLPSPPASDGLSSPLSLSSDGTGPLLSEDIPSLTSGEHSDWSSDNEDGGNDDEYDLIASQDFSVISASSGTHSSTSEARSSAPSEQDERMRLSFPDPLMETEGSQRDREYASSQGSLDMSSPEGSDSEENGSDVEYSLLLDAPHASKPPAPINIDSGLLSPESSYVKSIDDEEEATPVQSKIVERSGVDKANGAGTDDVARSADIAAWVRLTGDATTVKSVHHEPLHTPPLLTPKLDEDDSPNSVVVCPARERRPLQGSEANRYRESKRQQPSSAAKVTNPTPKETREVAECIKTKLEQLAAITHASASFASSSDRKHASASKITLALTAAAILVAAAAALVDPSSLSLNRSVETSLSAYNVTSPSTSTASPSSSTPTHVTVATSTAVAVSVPDDVSSPVKSDPIEAAVETANQAPPTATAASTCSLSNPGGCALALVDTRTALTVFAVDTFALRPSLFGGSLRSNSSPTTSTSASTLEDVIITTPERRERRDKRGQGCNQSIFCTSTNRKACRKPGHRHRRAIGFTESVRAPPTPAPPVSTLRDNPMVQEALLTFSVASRKAVYLTQNELVKFRDGRFRLAVKGGKRLRGMVKAQARKAAEEAKRSIEEARQVARAEGRKRILEAREEARRLLKEVEATLGETVVKGKEVAKYRVTRAAKGYGRVRRSEIKLQHVKRILRL